MVTKHGLAATMQASGDSFDALHDYFEVRLIPAVETIIAAAVSAGHVRSDVSAYELLRAVGNLCIDDGGDPRYYPQHAVSILLDGLRPPD